jgi:hypothetical protein
MSIGPGHNRLEDLEAQLLARLPPGDEPARQDDAAAVSKAFTAALQDGSLQDGSLQPEPPRPQPDSARRSSAELAWLAAAFGLAPGPQAQPEDGRSRAGYMLAGDPEGQDARVEPGLSAALALAASAQELDPTWTRRLCERFSDLPAVDMELWRALQAARVRPRELARIWLQSPGRRLVRDLEFIKYLGTGQPHGATRTDLDSLRRAAGVAGMPHDLHDLRAWLDSEPPRWRDLHCAVPGLLMRTWEPRDRKVSTALRRLDRPSPYSLRGAALAWLLSRAAGDPFYEIDGIRRDLRDDLPVRLAAALSDDSSPAPALSAELETALLQHAARIAERACPDLDDSGAICTAWSLSRWMYSCLTRSPFYGADEDSLAVRLRALLGKDAPRPGRDPLHPARIGPAGIDIADITLLAGIMSHYGGPGPYLDPMPLPLVHALRRMAGRSVREAEARAEADWLAQPSQAFEAQPQALATPGNALGWHSSHVAPPWVARRLLTDKRIAWMARQDSPTPMVRECLDALNARPDRFSWLGFAFYAEGHELPAALQARAAATWRDLAGAADSAGDAFMPAQALAAMAVGLLGQLDPAEHSLALDISTRAPEDWRPFLLDAHAEAALRAVRASADEQDRDATRAPMEAALCRALERLLDAVENPACSTHERLNSALMVLRRASAWPSERARPYLQRLAATTDAPPFRDHRGLQREIRRLGLRAVSSSA